MILEVNGERGAGATLKSPRMINSSMQILTSISTPPTRYYFAEASCASKTLGADHGEEEERFEGAW